MAVAGGQPSFEVLRQLHQQTSVLVVVLTIADFGNDVATMLAGLIDTAVAAEPLLAEMEPAVLLEISSAVAHARAGRHDDTRADLLMASRRLAIVLETKRPRRAAPADGPTLHWVFEP